MAIRAGPGGAAPWYRRLGTGRRGRPDAIHPSGHPFIKISCNLHEPCRVMMHDEVPTIDPHTGSDPNGSGKFSGFETLASRAFAPANSF